MGVFSKAVVLLLAATLAGAGVNTGLALAQNAPEQAAPSQVAPAPAPAKPADPFATTPPATPAKIEGDEVTAETDRTVQALKADFDTFRRIVKPETMKDDALNGARETLERLRGDLQGAIDRQQPRVSDLQSQLDALGPAPKAGETEPEATATDRKALNERMAQAQKPIRTAQALIRDAGSLLDQVNRQRRILFADRLMERFESPLLPSLWRNVGTEARGAWTRLETASRQWLPMLRDHGFYMALAIAGAVWVLASGLALWGIRRFRAWGRDVPPPVLKRAASAAWVVVFTALPLVAAAGALFFLMSAFGLLDPDLEKLASAAFAAICVIAFVNALAVTLLAPRRPEWRIFAAPDKVASRARVLLTAMSVVYGADLVMSALNEVISAPLVLVVAQSVLATAAFGILGCLLFLMPAKTFEVEGETGFRWLLLLRIPFAMASFAILVCAVIGYIPLARFIATQIVVTGTILALLYLIFLAIDAFAESLKEETSPGGRNLAALGMNETRRAQVALPIMLTLKVLTLMAAVPLILMQLGFAPDEIVTRFQQAFIGFTIGGFHVSLASFAAALIVFFIAYTLAKLFQEWLDGQVLSRAGISGSARDSIRTTIGYSGLIIATLAALSSAGVNFSNLAIVAGALSVGVGLGLQGIVNNFVSGLVLLAERPIRVNDWVEIGDQEGIVRKINFRATEIETFDRAIIVIPNSAIVSGNVKNWTLNNDTGRVTIPVSVSIDSDPEQVRSILARVAKEHMEVLTSPAPIVYFENFSASSLDFKLYVYLLNINRSFSVRTELRIAILKAFQEEGVQVPQTQVDTFIREFQGTALELAKQLAAQPAKLAALSPPPVKAQP